MSKIAEISIFLSFLGLWLTSFLKNETQVFVGFILILSFGISHGANDLLIIKKIRNENSTSYWKMLSIYIGTILIAILLFSFISWLVLLLFIIASGYHFGEQHWEKKKFTKQKIFHLLFQTNYGLLILLLLLHFHDEEVLKIIYGITDILISKDLLTISFVTSCFLQIVFFCYASYQSRMFQRNLIKELFYLIMFVIIFKVGSLIWGFTVYFIFWHSIPSLCDQIKFLYGDISFKNFKLFCQSALPYWIISMFGVVISYTYLREYKIFDSIFFTFLAAITFPHVIVIERMYNKLNKKTE